MTTPREAQIVLDFIADCTLTVEYDADTTDSGTQIDCSTFHIDGPIEALDALITAIGLKPRYDESIEEAIHRAIEESNP